MSSGSYNIVLLPEVAVAEKAIKTSAELAPLGTRFSLGAERCLPHVSLYMVRLADERLDEAGERLGRIAEASPALQLQADEYVQAEGYIDASYHKTEAIARLQQAILAAINPIRDGLHTEDAARLQTATGAAKHNIETYGYRGVGELFRPHLTLTRFVQTNPIPVEDLLAPSIFSGSYNRLAMCKMGHNGTCQRLMHQWELQ